MYIIMLGKPGAGKGTVGKILSEELGLFHLSSGDLFRGYIKEGKELGQKIQSYISQGQLLPDELTIECVEERLKQDDCINGVVLDGYPRTINQAKALDRFLEGQGKKIDVAINLYSSDEDIIKRTVTRRICSNRDCGEVYNDIHRRPQQDGICDVCGSKLIQREDDKEETIRKRLESYEKNTRPLIEYYENKNVLETKDIDIDNGRDGKVVAKEILTEFKQSV